MNAKAKAALTPLDQQTHTHATTPEAASYLRMSQQTLRIWACYGSGPIRPVKVGNRLLWPIDGIRRILAGGAA